HEPGLRRDGDGCASLVSLQSQQARTPSGACLGLDELLHAGIAVAFEGENEPALGHELEALVVESVIKTVDHLVGADHGEEESALFGRPAQAGLHRSESQLSVVSALTVLC